MVRRSRRAADLAAYAGKWVAFSRNRVVAVGTSLPEVMRSIPARDRVPRSGTKESRSDSSVFLVPRRDEGPYVLVITPAAW